MIKKTEEERKASRKASKSRHYQAHKKESYNYQKEHKEEIAVRKVVRRLKNKQAVLEYLGVKGCSCGESRLPTLEFHHRNPKEKEFNISRLLSASLKTLLKEVSKCEVICANCHRMLHWEEDNGTKD
jgi:hypothetical protein